MFLLTTIASVAFFFIAGVCGAGIAVLDIGASNPDALANGVLFGLLFGFIFAWMAYSSLMRDIKRLTSDIKRLQSAMRK